jgi:hypothetical protein
MRFVRRSTSRPLFRIRTEISTNADGSVYGSESRYPDRADKWGE